MLRPFIIAALSATIVAQWTPGPAVFDACPDPSRCTSMLPGQAEPGTLTLSQRRCYDSTGANSPDCCTSESCASWAGASVYSHAVDATPALYSVDAAVSSGRPSFARLSFAGVDVPMPISTGIARYVAIVGSGWFAVAANGILLSNASVAPARIALSLATAIGAAPQIVFEAAPPGAGPHAVLGAQRSDTWAEGPARRSRAPLPLRFD